MVERDELGVQRRLRTTTESKEVSSTTTRSKFRLGLDGISHVSPLVGSVPRPSDDGSVPDKDAADRDLVGGEGLLGLAQRERERRSPSVLSRCKRPADKQTDLL